LQIADKPAGALLDPSLFGGLALEQFPAAINGEFFSHIREFFCVVSGIFAALSKKYHLDALLHMG